MKNILDDFYAKLGGATPGDGGGDNPHGWSSLPEEFKLTDEDEKKGIANVLRESRDIASNALKKLFSVIGVKEEYYSHTSGMPIGINRKSYITGEYRAGLYGIVMGGESEDFLDFVDGKIDEEKAKKRFSQTMAHEMVHSVQTGTIKYGTIDTFNTIGSMIGKGKGFEEGMAEALSNIALKTRNESEISLADAASDLEAFANDYDVPCTQVAAYFISKAPKELLSWYITCAQSGEWKKENKLKKALGENYDQFLTNMNALHEYEEETGGPENVQEVVNQTKQMIDNME